MILDANDYAPNDEIVADVCIVGAGAAGISMALALAGSRVDVLVLESGALQPDTSVQDLYAGTVTDERLHSPPDRYRQRRFGGTTTIWGGRCMPFDGIDFESRDFMPNSGWPIGRDSLLPFYVKANQLCEAGEFSYTAAAGFAAPLRPMIAGFESTHFTTNTLERFSLPTDFGSRYGKRVRAAANVRVLLNANVVAVNLAAAGDRVDTLTVRTLTHKNLSVRARQVVLATGGLEVPRLLLASRDVHGDGVGNQHDVVGRYYQCHLAGTIGTLSVKGPLSAVWNGYDVAEDGVYCRRRLALTADTQRAKRIGNFVARLHHPRITDPAHRNAVLSLLYLAKPLIPYEYAKRLHGDEKLGSGDWLKHVRNVATGPLDALQFAWHMLKDRKLAERKFPSIIINPRANVYSLDFHAEQQPNRDSRISLGDAPDALGMPRINVDWRYTAVDLGTVSTSLALLADDLRQCGVGTFDYDPAGIEFEMTRYGAYGGHHIGTARMGNDPRSSVVDADCRVHGVGNLSIASSAVFPTSSQANPTLTVVALALRLAARLAGELAAEVTPTACDAVARTAARR